MGSITKNLYLKITCLFAAASFVGIGLVTNLYYENSLKQLKTQIQSELLAIVKTAAPQINGDLHNLIFALEPGEIEFKEEFDLIRGQLSQIQKDNQLLGPGSPLYTLRLKEDEGDLKTEFVVMTQKNEEGFWFTGYEYPLKDHLKEAFSGEFSCTDIYQDSEGVWISAAAPIKNQDGDIVAVLQADRHISHVLNLTRKKSREMILWSLAGFLLLMVLAGFGALYLLHPLREVISHIRKYGKGDVKDDLPVLSQDEIGELSNAFNRMTKRLSETQISKDFLDTILKNMDVGVLVVSSQFKVINVNEKLGDMIRSPEKELISKNLNDIITYSNYECLEIDESELILSNGERLPVIISMTQLPNENLIVTAIDNSKRKQAELALSKSLKKLEQTNKELKSSQLQLVQQEKMASVGQLSAGIAHEINNPIGFICSNLDTLKEYVEELSTYFESREEPLEDDLKYILDDLEPIVSECKDGSKRVKDIVQDLKTFVHMDNENEYSTVDLNECLENTLQIANNAIKFKANVKTEYGDIPKLEVQGTKVNQVFLNLIMNGVQAMKEKGVISINTILNEGQIEVRISDTGTGIPEENMKKLFTPFFTTKPVGEGTGLGLSISYNIIKEHGGNLEVESTGPDGTCFKISLPLNKGNTQSEE